MSSNESVVTVIGVEADRDCGEGVVVAKAVKEGSATITVTARKPDGSTLTAQHDVSALWETLMLEPVFDFQAGSWSEYRTVSKNGKVYGELSLCDGEQFRFYLRPMALIGGQLVEVDNADTSNIKITYTATGTGATGAAAELRVASETNPDSTKIKNFDYYTINKNGVKEDPANWNVWPNEYKDDKTKNLGIVFSGSMSQSSGSYTISKESETEGGKALYMFGHNWDHTIPCYYIKELMIPYPVECEKEESIVGYQQYYDTKTPIYKTTGYYAKRPKTSDSPVFPVDWNYNRNEPETFAPHQYTDRWGNKPMFAWMPDGERHNRWSFSLEYLPEAQKVYNKDHRTGVYAGVKFHDHFPVHGDNCLGYGNLDENKHALFGCMVELDKNDEKLSCPYGLAVPDSTETNKNLADGSNNYKLLADPTDRLTGDNKDKWKACVKDGWRIPHWAFKRYDFQGVSELKRHVPRNAFESNPYLYCPGYSRYGDGPTGGCNTDSALVTVNTVRQNELDKLDYSKCDFWPKEGIMEEFVTVVDAECPPFSEFCKSSGSDKGLISITRTTGNGTYTTCVYVSLTLLPCKANSKDYWTKLQEADKNATFTMPGLPEISDEPEKLTWVNSTGLDLYTTDYPSGGALSAWPVNNVGTKWTPASGEVLCELNGAFLFDGNGKLYTAPSAVQNPYIFTGPDGWGYAYSRKPNTSGEFVENGVLLKAVKEGSTLYKNEASQPTIFSVAKGSVNVTEDGEVYTQTYLARTVMYTPTGNGLWTKVENNAVVHLEITDTDMTIYERNPDGKTWKMLSDTYRFDSAWKRYKKKGTTPIYTDDAGAKFYFDNNGNKWTHKYGTDPDVSDFGPYVYGSDTICFDIEWSKYFDYNDTTGTKDGNTYYVTPGQQATLVSD